MTITIGWVRRNKDTSELLIASDSRLRSRGAMSQCQKIFRLERGDCCLGFSGDAQVAFPLFIQVGSAINNYIRMRTRAMDINDVAQKIEDLLKNFINGWDLDNNAKHEELKDTRILFAGWSWKYKRFDIGFFEHRNDAFAFHHRKANVPHPWKEKNRSLVFIGDYYRDYMKCLANVLEARHGSQPKYKKSAIDFDYEPVEALHQLLKCGEKKNHLPMIGGAPQLLKIYSYGNSLPIVIRTEKNVHSLLGRRLSRWEKTEYPILDLSRSNPAFAYPMSAIPNPEKIDIRATANMESSSE